MTDQFNVTAAFDKPTYAVGDVMKLSITGDDVHTDVQNVPITGTMNFVASDGATGNASFSGQMSKQVATHESVKITSVTDTDGRTWTVDPGGLFATATA